jgi:hypothetical protein
MPPNLYRKLQYFADAAKRLSEIARVRNVSFFTLFLADTSSVFGNRQDHDKHAIFVRLANVRKLAPYLARTVLLPTRWSSSTAILSRSVRFPLVLKPIRGVQSVGIIGVRDEKALWRFLRSRRAFYVAQPLIADALEIGVSFTRNPNGAPDFFGVAAKQPVTSTNEWKGGFRKIPKYFHHRDITRNVDRERLLELCRSIAETLGTNCLRFDAFIRIEGAKLKLDTMQIIDVNTGVFAVDEFLFDPRHSPRYVVEELTRKYTYLLLWGERQALRPTPSLIRQLLLHYLYCYVVTLQGHLMETTLMSKCRDGIVGLAALLNRNMTVKGGLD